MARRLIMLFVVVGLLLTTVGAASAQEADNHGYGQTQCISYHTVQYRQNLTQIARLYGTTVQYLVSINGIYNPNYIYPGQVLCIQQQQVPPPVCSSYVVQYGDRLYRIGAYFGVPWRLIAQVNNLYNPNVIYAGQVLVIPCHY